MGTISQYLTTGELWALNTGLSVSSLLSLLLIFITCWINPTTYRNKHGKWFMSCVGADFLTIFFDLIERIFMYKSQHIVLFTVSTYASYIFGGVFELFAFCFVFSLIEEKQQINKYLKHAIILANDFAIAVFLIPGIMNRVIFILSDATCVRGSLYPIRVVLNVVITILTYFLIIYYRKALGTRDFILFMIFFTFPIVLSVQSFWPDIPSIVSMSFLLMFMYISIYQARINDSLRREAKLAKKIAKNADAQTKVVLSQIQPHFLYNTLGSIAYLCAKEPQKAQQLTGDFAKYLRGNLGALNSENKIPFQVELEHIKTYLSIELVRFSDRLTVEYDIKAENFLLPALVVEPLVENAVKHGICEKFEGGTVKISSKETETGFEIIVADNGAGYDTTAEFDNNHVGIANVKERLNILCSGTLTMESQIGTGTTATIFIPKEEATC